MTTKPNNPTAADQPTTAVHLPSALLALRERSRILLRERFEHLHALELRLQGQLGELIAELERDKAPTEAATGASERILALEAEVRQLQRRREESERALDEARAMLAEMEEEYRALRERLEGNETRPADGSATPEDSEHVERLQRRLDMALDEIRELKEQNAELASRPAQAASRHHAADDGDPKSWDWETQKKRLLQQLESDFDTKQPEQAKEKLKIEEVLRTTDRIVAEKDREIELLKQQLAEQPVAVAGPAPDEAIAQAVDADSAIQAERERLKQIQEEWREKLRKAEVEISIERAKLARERLTLEEKLRSLQVQATTTPEETAKTEDPKAAGGRGKWLTRLGLGGNEQA